MISSVTTTISTIVSSAVSTSLLTSLGVAGVITLACALIMKELTTGEGIGVRFFDRNLDIVILPLLYVFAFIVSMKVWEILS